MISENFNDGWEFRRKTNTFTEMGGLGEPWTAVRLPHDAMILEDRSPSAIQASGFFPRGVWEYRKTFEIPTGDANDVVILEFEGIYRDALVYVNGTVVAQWPSGYAERRVDVSDLVNSEGPNEVRVDCQTGDDSRWYSGAGIYRNVWLRRSRQLHLEAGSLAIETPTIDEEIACVVVKSTVRNRGPVSRRISVGIELTGPDGSVVVRDEHPLSLDGGSTESVHRRLFVEQPARWGLEHPELYSCRVSLVEGEIAIDEETSTFGIRTISADPLRGFLLNGERTPLRGACVHHDNGVLGAATFERAEERRVELLKEAGFNALRSSHNPMSRAMLKACDRLGMLVMDETFDMWTEPKSNEDYALRFHDWWERDLESTIGKDRNHPCVVLYSIGNEIPELGRREGLQYNRALAAKVRELDPSRLVTNSISGLLIGGDEMFAELRSNMAAASTGEPGDSPDGDEEGRGVNTIMTDLSSILSRLMMSPVIAANSEEPLAALDVAGYNYMESRFELDRENYPQRVILATESHPTAIDVIWGKVEANPHVIGDFTWTGWDYLGEPGAGRIEFVDAEQPNGPSAFMGSFPWLAAWTGDLDITGHRRPQSYYREIVFGLRDDPFIAVRQPENAGKDIHHSSPWSWSDVVESWSWPQHEGAPTVVEVYADADEVELLLNSLSLGSAPCRREQRYRANFNVVVESGVLEAVARRDGTETGRTSLRSATDDVHLVLDADRTTVTTAPGDLCYVGISFVDPQGTVDGSANREVSLRVDGPGVLQGLGSADPTTLEKFTADRCTTFRGRAIAVVRPTAPGIIAVTATSSNVPDAAMDIHVVRSSVATSPPSAH